MGLNKKIPDLNVYVSYKAGAKTSKQGGGVRKWIVRIMVIPVEIQLGHKAVIKKKTRVNVQPCVFCFCVYYSSMCLCDDHEPLLALARSSRKEKKVVPGSEVSLQVNCRREGEACFPVVDMKKKGKKSREEAKEGWGRRKEEGSRKKGREEKEKTEQGRTETQNQRHKNAMFFSPLDEVFPLLVESKRKFSKRDRPP